MDDLSHEGSLHQHPGNEHARCGPGSQVPSSGSELHWELKQCDPPQGERRRLIVILSITKRSPTVTYRNNG